jgi:hypothetical protein
MSGKVRLPMRIPLRLWVLILVLAAGLPGAPAIAAAARPYDVHFHARFEPDDGFAYATIEVVQSRGRLSQLDFNAPSPRFSQFEGDGEIAREGDRLLWRVPEGGGRLNYRVLVDKQRRGSGAHDARMTKTWVVMRLDNLFPSARVVGSPRASSRSTLHLTGPSGWAYETPYGPAREPVEVTERGRRFTRPVGWFAAGDIGIRRSVIAGRDVAIAGPRGENFRRMDMLTFLHWTIPELARVVPTLPDRLVIVAGSDDMWRGGLSGPASLYLHPGRPLVSGNSTSTLLHELMHVAMQGLGEHGDDWIVEGVPEYYSLVILLRSGGIDGERFERALDWLQRWVRREDGKLAHPSNGADTARAALLFRDLDLELASKGARLDDVVRELFGGGPINRSRLSALVEAELGEPSGVLERALRAAPSQRARN